MSKANNNITVYIDGAARGNPGPAGIGVLLVIDSQDSNSKSVKSFYKYLGESTNNIAEYMALIYGAQEALISGYKKVTIKTDSELVAKQISGEYKVRDSNLRLLYEQFLHLKQGFARLQVESISREENKEADKLANKAINSVHTTKTQRNIKFHV